MTPPGPTILLVEDSEDDAFLLERALQKTGIPAPVQLVTDGQQAIDYLAGNSHFQDRTRFPLPSFIFLDLKLPYVSGFEVLAWVRQKNEFNATSVAILTGSAELRDQERARALGAQYYLVKPPTSQSLKSVLDASLSFPLSS